MTDRYGRITGTGIAILAALLVGSALLTWSTVDTAPRQMAAVDTSSEELHGAEFVQDQGNSSLFRRTSPLGEVHVFLVNGQVDRVYVRNGQSVSASCTQASETFDVERIERAEEVLAAAWPDASRGDRHRVESDGVSCSISL